MFCHLADGSWCGLAAPRQKRGQPEFTLIESENESMPTDVAYGREKLTGA
jgi:hypothetical protein